MNELSIIIPCVSSIEVLPQFIDELAAYIMINPSDIDIIVVANEKVHAIGKLVHSVHKKYPWLKIEFLQRTGNTRSYGALVRFGIAYSMSRYVVLVSPYGDDDITLIMPMLNKIRTNVQVVQVTRYASREDARHVPLRFRFYQAFYRRLTRILLGLTISDSTYGFKMFDRVFIQAIGLTQNSYSICPEITFKALMAGGTVGYIPSKIKSTSMKQDFKLYQEGVKYVWLLLRGFAHRLGILWF